MLRNGENVFLDDVTLDELAGEIGTKIRVVESSGKEFVEALLGEESSAETSRRQNYEQTDSSYCGQT